LLLLPLLLLLLLPQLLATVAAAVVDRRPPAFISIIVLGSTKGVGSFNLFEYEGRCDGWCGTI
jgi:hypothetical protein